MLIKKHKDSLPSDIPTYLLTDDGTKLLKILEEEKKIWVSSLDKNKVDLGDPNFGFGSHCL
jgi:hypothetical protein